MRWPVSSWFTRENIIGQAVKNDRANILYRVVIARSTYIDYYLSHKNQYVISRFI